MLGGIRPTPSLAIYEAGWGGTGGSANTQEVYGHSDFRAKISRPLQASGAGVAFRLSKTKPAIHLLHRVNVLQHKSMNWPGEALLIKLWETLAEKGVGGA